QITSTRLEVNRVLSALAAAVPAAVAVSALVAALAAGTQGLPDLLALGADRETLRITTGDPDLAAQRDHRSAHDHRLGQLVLGYVVGEAFVVAVIDPEL